ncbi:hypothetical protein NM208_g7041 [Fusarium decemcellulare]|uniref:Uncharacterized protein n=1 Tax=Fusarium decemcellulare TaxID=57161 RepID=A0ACC1SB05_9HYPO|nr:hypothetical protein NM208_g7041 [Fusarium decemcellulare]
MPPIIFHRIGPGPRGRQGIQLDDAERFFRGWDPDQAVYPTGHQEWRHLAEAYRHACLLRILRFPDSFALSCEDPRIKASVAAIFDVCAAIPRDTAFYKRLLFPLFLAGADTSSQHQMHYASWCVGEIKHATGFQHPAMTEMLTNVWEERRTNPNGWSNVPWMEFPGLVSAFLWPLCRKHVVGALWARVVMVGHELGVFPIRGPNDLLHGQDVRAFLVRFNFSQFPSLSVISDLKGNLGRRKVEQESSRATMATKAKVPAELEKASKLAHVPHCEEYDSFVPELEMGRLLGRKFMHEYNNWFPEGADLNTKTVTTKRAEMLRGRIGHVADDEVFVEPPLRVDYGPNISLGKRFYANFNLTILDSAIVTIGDRVMVGPNVMISTATHEIEVASRRDNIEYASPVTIGDDCWIGGGVIILPGVTIGDGCTIGAGSVVTRDIPAWSVAIGSPARVVKKVQQLDKVVNGSSIWVDAVCINQDDPLEKDKQIPKMKDIYSKAGQVTIWIGNDEDFKPGDVDMAFDFAKLMVEIDLERQIESLCETSAAISSAMYPPGFSALNSKKISNLQMLLERPWFSRLWVVQEAVLGVTSAKLICGHSSIPFYYLIGSVRPLAEANQTLSHHFTGARCMKYIFELRHPRGRLSHNLSWEEELALYLEGTTEFNCTNPRDRFYSLHGLLRCNHTPRKLRPQYKDPVDSIFRSYGTYLLEHGKIFNILAASSYARNSTWPSWVPNWEGQFVFHSGLGDNAHLGLLEGGTVLEVDSLILSNIVAFTNPGKISTIDLPWPKVPRKSNQFSSHDPEDATEEFKEFIRLVHEEELWRPQYQDSLIWSPNKLDGYPPQSQRITDIGSYNEFPAREWKRT